MNVLIVEDDRALRQVFRMTLDNQGTIAEAENGPSALALVAVSWANNHPYDVIFLDLMMPHMDGLTVLDAIKQIERCNNITGSRGSRIVILTGVDDVSTIKRAFRQQADEYLVKPIKPHQLLEVAERLTDDVRNKRNATKTPIPQEKPF